MEVYSVIYVHVNIVSNKKKLCLSVSIYLIKSIMLLHGYAHRRNSWGGGQGGEGPPPKLRRVGYSSLYPPQKKLSASRRNVAPPPQLGLLTQNCANGYANIGLLRVSITQS